MSGRKKSCAPCRTSKAKCSLDLPCRRCADRHLDCKYDHLPRRAAARVLRPVGSNRGSGPPVLPEKDAWLPSNGVIGPWPDITAPFASDGSALVSQVSDVNEMSSQSIDYWVDSGSSGPTSSLEPFPGCGLQLLDQRFEQMIAAPLRVPQLLPFDNSIPFESAGIPWLQQQSPNMSDSALVAIQSPKTPHPTTLRGQPLSGQVNKHYNESPFLPRVRKPVSASFTAKVLLGQLLSYPEMMVKGGRLPPFIFPQCAIDGVVSPAECSSQGYHRCLPEELAICCSLIQSYEARTPGSAAFVWKSIYKEVERIREEYMSFDLKRLVAACQALGLYVLLQAKDRDSIPDNDIDTLLSTPVLIARRLFYTCDYAANLVNGASLDRQEWVLRESLRRNVCLNFGFELLVDVDFSGGKSTSCGYDHVALPTGRYLWEPVSNIEWAARYKKMEDDIRKKPLSIQDLRRTRRATGSEFSQELEEADITTRVSAWCDGLDEFGLLVWMAVMME